MAILTMAVLGILANPLAVFAAEEEAAQPAFYATFWALVPPVVAICLALITKEVYSSLFLGILMGGLLYSGFAFEGTVTHIFQDGIISVLSDSYNVGILIFLVILGAMVCMMNKAGGSAAFGRWASKRIKTRVGAELATVVLGILIFIDDYFNCLTVGSVMRPVTDKHHVSRAKLAYLNRFYSRSGMYYCSDFFLGCCSQWFCRGRGWTFYFCPRHSVQFLCAAYHCHDGWYGSDENRVWKHENS